MKLTKIKNNNSLKPTTQKQNEPKKKIILIWKFETHADLKTLLKEIFIKLKEKLMAYLDGGGEWGEVE